ncbi:ATP-binding protein [Clostridium perfringens]|uniref:ATP-binding protein n=1 Tax=Clostridium perfringens TaxID=1502 RepID=UPI002245F2E7|nr:ATP-binding protein [Clostridium perfringens]MCX0359270.1 ATP-binding protein [Clostridium perfringens]MCX0420554.1 ATP-binding protein [Clostridium perfringens]
MGKMKYKISSRATILLGRESVSKVDGAIIELVKNTYDADATLCFICFNIENDEIYILDNGTGMTKDIIENCWMTIGTDNKKRKYESERKRIRSGEKGIGRFALDRLGNKCEMYTKSKIDGKLILWINDWKNFEQEGKMIDEIEADFDYIDKNFKDIIPNEILSSIKRLNEEREVTSKINIDNGTLLKISGLRDEWDERDIGRIINSMGFLLPPSEQKDYTLCIQKSFKDDYIIIENDIAQEYDYKLSANFDGEKFHVVLNRNEFDLNKIPKKIFEMDRFKMYPYRFEDFKKGVFEQDYTISELMINKDKDFIESIKKIGKFEFNYIFMKLSLTDDSSETFFYKEISRNRKNWLENHGGIKIYRDNFLVRPYGDPEADAYDWLGIDARRAKNPAALSNVGGNWHVRNKQSQGTLLISRLDNECILDKSSREGIIENDYFKLLKKVILSIISIFEKDRSYIGITMKMYSDMVNEKQKTKETGKNIAKQVLEEKKKENNNYLKSDEKFKILAKTVQYFEEEREELITEIKLLRSLATNGLITTSIVHDLKGINAVLVNRVDAIRIAINMNNEMLISRNLSDLKKNDTFLKSWITVITNQVKRDKRRRVKKDFYEAIEEILNIMEPILVQKRIKINLTLDNKKVFKKIFVSDFESILYNLIINSIESLEKSKVKERIIEIDIKTDEVITLNYKDNGNGIADVFKNPYDIFNYGTTSKYDVNGEVIGTGLGMYIVASTAREYNAKYKITECNNGFGMEFKFPV